MKITINREILVAALSTVKTVARGSLPILHHVLINTFVASAEFICTNLDLTIRTKAACQVARKGTVAVPVAALHSLASSLTGDDLQLELIKGRLILSCGDSRYSLGVLDAAEFPPLSRPKPAQEFQLQQADLKSILALSGFCASDDDSRYVLESTFLHIAPEIIAVSTDGRRLAKSTIRTSGLAKKSLDLLLPIQAVAELVRLLSSEANAAVQIAAGANACLFDMGDTILATKLIDGNYPNYAQVIPAAEPSATRSLDREPLLDSIKRCAIIGEDIQLDFKKTALTVSSEADGKKLVGEGAEILSVPTGPDLRVRLQAAYLLEALSATASATIQFFGLPLGPCVFSLPDQSWLCVIMPMRGGDKAAASTSAPQPSTLNSQPV